MVLTKATDAMCVQRHVGRGQQFLCFSQLFIGDVDRQVLAVELDIMQAHALDMANGFDGVEIPQRVTLHTDRPTAVWIIGDQVSGTENLGDFEKRGARGGRGRLLSICRYKKSKQTFYRRVI